MKKTWVKISAFVFAVALMTPVSLLAQKDEKAPKEEKGNKGGRQIIVTTKGDKDEKIVVEVVGDKITVNGKPIEDLKNEGDINVRISKLKDMNALTRITGKTGTTWSYNGDGQYNLFNTADTNQAMLGVTTDKTEEGVKIQEVTEKSGAEKAGLKEGDIITKIDDKKIEDPDDLSKEVRAHKPGDKVSVTYLRDKKEQKVTAELGKWKGFTVVNGFNMNNLNFDKLTTPRAFTIPRTTYGQAFSWSGGSPKLGISVQDTDDGKGVKVIEVDEESNAAKAGVKEDDVIAEVDGKAVNSTDEMVKLIKESKEKASIMIKLQRAGKTQNIEVKMPKKIKTADL